jgi:hypothetical protein
MKIIAAGLPLICLGVGCTVPDDEPEIPPFRPLIGEGGHEMQGRTILGQIDDLPRQGGNYYAVSTLSTTGFRADVSYGEFIATQTLASGTVTLAGPSLAGQVFRAPDESQLQILAVLPATADDPVHYILQYTAKDGTTSDPCEGEGAIAISGRYSGTREHIDDPDSFTFSCVKGVAHKCKLWGYPDPGDETHDLWSLNAACTRLAGGDFCYEGVPNTREGTAIAMFDRLGIRAPFPDGPNGPGWGPWILTSWPPPAWNPPNAPEFFVEAVWRKSGGAKCMAKQRWASLPFDPCPAVMDDPRTTTDGKYCEEYSTDYWTDSDVEMVSVSMYNDLRLDVWKTPLGDRVATVRGFRDDADLSDSLPPFPGMIWVGQSGVLLRALTAELDPNLLTDVNLYCLPNSKKCVVTTPTLAPTTYIDRGFEGYVFIDQHANSIELVQYYNATSQDYVTQTTPPGPGYARRSRVGYVLPNP